jgi:hypothetical protein
MKKQELYEETQILRRLIDDQILAERGAAEDCEEEFSDWDESDEDGDQQQNQEEIFLPILKQLLFAYESRFACLEL